MDSREICRCGFGSLVVSPLWGRARPHEGVLRLEEAMLRLHKDMIRSCENAWNFAYELVGVGGDVWRWLFRHLSQKKSAHLHRGLSRVSSMRRHGSKDPHQPDQIWRFHFELYHLSLKWTHSYCRNELHNNTCRWCPYLRLVQIYRKHIFTRFWQSVQKQY